MAVRIGVLIEVFDHGWPSSDRVWAKSLEVMEADDPDIEGKVGLMVAGARAKAAELEANRESRPAADPG